jgi:hypothetical protein
MQDSATAHTANNSMNAIAEVFGEQVISPQLWSTHSPDLNPYDFYSRDILKDNVYVNNPHSLWELKKNIQEEMSIIPTLNFAVRLETFFSRGEACIEAGQHFKALFWTKVGHAGRGILAANNRLLLLYVENLP